MAQQTQTLCDAPHCGKDITEGNGRHWRLAVMSEVIRMAEGTAPRHDAGDVLPQVHFCSEACLAAWANEAADRKAADQIDFEEANAKAAAAKARGNAEENA